jgi:hypothetical protein
MMILAGTVGWILGLHYWESRTFGPLDPSKTFRFVIPGFLGIILGIQIILSSFFLSVLGMARRGATGIVKS